MRKTYLCLTGNSKTNNSSDSNAHSLKYSSFVHWSLLATEPLKNDYVLGLKVGTGKNSEP